VRSNSGPAAVVDITDPTDLLHFGALAATWTTATPDAALFSGEWAIDRDNKVLYVADWSAQVIHAYNLSSLWGTTPGTPVKLPDFQWDTSHDSGVPTSLATAGQVLVLGYYTKMAWVNIANPQQLKLITPGSDDMWATNLTRNCAKAFGDDLSMLRAFQNPSGSQYPGTYVIRSMIGSGDIVQVNDSCLDTTPKPALTVARDANQGTLDTSCTGGDAKGYPADTFTITNTSGGVWANPVLTVSPIQGTITVTDGTHWRWTAPANATRTFTFDLDVTDAAGVIHFKASEQSPPTTKTAVLCSAPKASAAVTAVQLGSSGTFNACTTCTYLTGDTVQVSADNAAHTLTQGHPTAYGWIVADPVSGQGSPQIGSGMTSVNVPLVNPGTYTVWVAAQYGFTGTNYGCTGAPASILGSGTYNACVQVTLPSQPFSVSQITVSDGTTTATAATNSAPPTLLRANPITFSAAYRVAPGYTPTFLWAVNNVSSPPAPNPPTVTTGTVTGTIPSSGIAAANGYSASFLQASAQGPTGGPVDLKGTVTPVVFNVSDCQVPGAASSPQPISGMTNYTPGTVVLSWTASGTTPRQYDVVDVTSPVLGTPVLCDHTSNTYCSTSLVAGQLLKWQVITYNACSPASGVAGPVWTLQAAPPSGGGGGGGGCVTVSGNFTTSPGQPTAGAPVTFIPNVSGMTVTPADWSWTFGDGGSPIFGGGGGGTSTEKQPTYTYAEPGTYTVTLTATNGCGSSATIRQSVVVGSVCTASLAPAASFDYSPKPAHVGQPVQFTDLSSNSPTTWSWDFGDGAGIVAGGTSTQQSPAYTFESAGTFTVKLTAANCRGSSTTQQQVQVSASCDQTAVPTADFTWGPTGPLPGYPSQQQPFVGQTVTLTDASSNSPTSWHWYDFQEDTVNTTVTKPTLTHTWNQSGDKNVRMVATNCFGSSTEVLKVVHIYDDVRPVVADFAWSPAANITTDMPVTFTASQGTSYGNPGTFTWTFDDGSTQTGSSVTYSFKCGGNRTVTLTAARGSYSGTSSKSVSVAGPTCGPESVMAVDAAKVQGQNGTNWHADVRIYNPSSGYSVVTVEFLPVGWDNSAPNGSFRTLAPRETWVLDDILQWAQNQSLIAMDVKKTALRVTYKNDDDVPPVVTVRTYNLLSDGSKYGQINPGVEVVPGTTPPVQWLTGLRNNGLADGFRTNYSVLNLRGDPGGVSGITFTLFDESGTVQASKTFGLAPFGYIQDSIKNFFGGAFEDIGTFSLRVEVPNDADVQVYASVMDNHTSDPVMIPASVTPDSPIYLPAIAHISGEANTVWRSDIQFTNPDTSSAHTWEVRYTPKGTSLPVVARSLTLDPGKSIFVDDLVSAEYEESSTPLAEDAQTSGIVRIAPTDGFAVYPAVAARSYNLTPNGTFGQGIPPLWAAKGLSAGDGRRLVLTGMSSEDIARTNFGFVNLSEDRGVNFVVYFYDEAGHVLNPPGTDGQPKPYTFAIGPGTWDQDKLENRFKNAFKVTLPANLRAITAEIKVTDGGPGFAYASVIDSKTGDPNFIAAQLRP
jgi:PKD repeat protein